MTVCVSGGGSVTDWHENEGEIKGRNSLNAREVGIEEEKYFWYRYTQAYIYLAYVSYMRGYTIAYDTGAINWTQGERVQDDRLQGQKLPCRPRRLLNKGLDLFFSFIFLRSSSSGVEGWWRNRSSSWIKDQG